MTRRMANDAHTDHQVRASYTDEWGGKTRQGGSLGLGVMPPSPVILVVGRKIQKWKEIEVQLEVFVRWHILTRVLMSPS